MPRTQQPGADLANENEVAGADSSHITDPAANTRAAALVAEREGGATFAQRLGAQFGDGIRDLVLRYVSEETFQRLGQQAFSSAINQVASQITAAGAHGTVVDRLNAELLAADFRRELGAATQQLMATGAGADLASALASHLQDQPAALIAALITAAAVAYATDASIPQLSQSLHVAGGLTASVYANLGSLRHIALQDIGAQLAYQAGAFKASFRYDHLTGNAASSAIRGAGGGTSSLGGQLVHGALPTGAVDHIAADVGFKLANLGGGANVGLSDNVYLRNGHVVQGTIAIRGDVKLDNAWTLNASAQHTTGQNAGSQLDLAASYHPNANTSATITLTDRLNGVSSGLGVDFKMQVGERFLFEGKYDEHRGSYVGVVYHVSF